MRCNAKGLRENERLRSGSVRSPRPSPPVDHRHASARDHAARSEIAAMTGLSPQVVTSRRRRIAARRADSGGRPPAIGARAAAGRPGAQPRGRLCSRCSGRDRPVDRHRLRSGRQCPSRNERSRCRTDDPDTALRSLRTLVDDLKARSGIDAEPALGARHRAAGTFRLRRGDRTRSFGHAGVVAGAVSRACSPKPWRCPSSSEMTPPRRPSASISTVWRATFERSSTSI